ncbi:MAG TPA: type II secretion system protein [Steroidobacteraceae bacterium]|nr:type II secretion system protein [Steroidobacteraceae bacterium]
MSSHVRCRGVTLIELIVTIVVITAAVSAVLAIVSSTAARSADNLVQTQAVTIAQSYLNEILAKPFGSDPCAPACSRTQMNAVGDYNNLTDIGVHDEQGNAVTTLANYDVRVSVVGSPLGTVNVVPATQSVLVTVTVTPPNGAIAMLSGYRTLYP